MAPGVKVQDSAANSILGNVFHRCHAVKASRIQRFQQLVAVQNHAGFKHMQAAIQLLGFRMQVHQLTQTADQHQGVAQP